MYTAPTEAACAVPVKAKAAPAITAAATIAPVTLAVRLVLRRCPTVLPIACLPLCYWGVGGCGSTLAARKRTIVRFGALLVSLRFRLRKG